MLGWPVQDLGAAQQVLKVMSVNGDVVRQGRSAAVAAASMEGQASVRVTPVVVGDGVVTPDVLVARRQLGEFYVQAGVGVGRLRLPTGNCNM